VSDPTEINLALSWWWWWFDWWVAPPLPCIGSVRDPQTILITAFGTDSISCSWPEES
jgi:hypothetical protein